MILYIYYVLGVRQILIQHKKRVGGSGAADADHFEANSGAHFDADPGMRPSSIMIFLS